jgi:uncharacterized protein (DUF1800 family)
MNQTALAEVQQEQAVKEVQATEPTPATPWWLGAAAVATLAGCGGGEGDSGSMAWPAAFAQPETAQPMRQILAAASATAVPSAAPVPSIDELFNWAERAYTGFFPGPQANQFSAPYTYRFYPATGNYLGVADGRVYILGPVSGDVLGDVGALADFASRVANPLYAFTDAQAARFLGQATLGVTDTDIAAVRALGYDAWLTQQFALPVSSGNWEWLVSRAYDVNPDSRNAAIGFDMQIWQRLLTAPDSLRQRVALALSEIFVVGFDGVSGTYKQFKMAAWWDLLANHAFGNFRSLLEAVTLNSAMGIYLNTSTNRKEDAATGRVPDENYAREVMQLFTIGLVELHPDGTPRRDAAGRAIDSYTQSTVTNLARVFTGWRLDAPRTGEVGPEFVRRPMVLQASQHSTLEANFLGARVPAGTDGVAALKIAMDTLAAHPNVGPFIGRQLIQRLVTSNPSPYYVARVAQVFADNGRGVRGDLAAVVRAVLTDVEARDEAVATWPHVGKLREPIVRFIQWARSFKATSLGGNWDVGNTADPARALGQSPLRSPSVFNFFRPGYVPAGTSLAAAGWMAPEFQLANESSVAGYLNTMQSFVSRAHRDVRPNYATELALAGDPAALLARVELLLCAGQLQASTRQTILDAVTSIAATNDTGRANRVYTTVLLVMASTDYLVQK